MIDPTPPAEATIHLDLTLEERALLVTALRLLLSTLGREEADEIGEIHALLAKLAD